MTALRFVASVVVLVSLMGCEPKNEPGDSQPGDSQQEAREGVVEGTGEPGRAEQTPDGHAIRGKVMAVDREKPSVTLDHEEIPGLMEAMKMEFPVDDAQVLEGLEAGDQVEGQLVEKEGYHEITELERHGK